MRKGEKGIRIFAPVVIKNSKIEKEEEDQSRKPKNSHAITFFRTVSVFDVSQTEGSPLPEPSQARGDATNLITCIEKSIIESGIKLEYGDTRRALGKSCKGMIVIKPNMSSAETFIAVAKIMCGN